MCTQYNGNLKDIIIMPIEIYWQNLCLSYDRTNLFLTTVGRLILYGFIYYYLSNYFKTQIGLEFDADTFENIDNFLLAIICLNFISLALVLSNVPIN